ncbi:MAG TPA: efflux RND transporter periplasmic adaptor subunit [Vicinamibacterales bacterium]|nr:efflux RND transporter periplasmic adaptor subunit [Vicinamibacterales bacterium]
MRVEPVRSGTLNRTITLSGALAAEEQAVLSTKVAGRIQTIVVDLGSSVRQGQEIARLDPTDFELRVSQAAAALQQARARLGLPPDGEHDHVTVAEAAIVRQAQAVLDEARLSLDRTRTFVERGISSRAELDAAEAAFKVAEGRLQDSIEEVHSRRAILAQRRSELELAQEQLSATMLRAPFDGRVRERTAAVGQYTSAGTPLVTLVRVHPLRLRLEVPEREAQSVQLGQEVQVTVEGEQAVYAGRVARISPAISEDNRTLLVEAEIPNERGLLRPGAFVRANIVIEAAAPALLVPASAIVSFAGVTKVFSIADGKAVERRVQPGRREGASVEIVQGLSAGDLIVIEPGSLVAGEAVRTGEGR